MRVREYVGLSARSQRLLVRAMEICLVGMFFIGLDRNNTGIIINSLVGIGVTRVPGLLERDYDIPMDAGLTLWITAAVFLHTLGTVGLPDTVVGLFRSIGVGVTDGSFYKETWWWDHMTHALSASVVAATGYSVARAIDVHDENVSLPPQFMFAFILVVTVAFGVFWEVLEFAIGEAAALTGSGSVLTQYGLGDTLLDLVFDSIGAVVVAVWGTAHLSDVAGAIADRLESRNDRDGA